MMFDLAPRLRHSRQNRQAFFHTPVTLACPACGAGVGFEPRQIGARCGQCRTPLHRQPDDDTAIAPTGLLPFRLSEDEAWARLSATEGFAGEPDGPDAPRVVRLYVPYWRLAAHVNASWSVQEYVRHLETYETRSGGVASDYDEAVLATTTEDGVLARLEPAHVSEADPYESSLLGDVAVDLPTVALSDAWTAMRERWDRRLDELMRRNDSSGLTDHRQSDSLSCEYTQERGALVYVPVFVLERADSSRLTWVVDGYSGQVARARRARKARAADEELPAVSEKAIGIGVLLVLAVVMLLMGLWLVRRLWWY